MSAFHLLVPGLFGPMPARDAAAVELDLPLLQRLLARADRQSAPGDEFASTLTSLCGVATDAAEPPLAALRRLGDGGAVDGRYWLQLNPVHLRPDQDRLLLFDTLDLEFTLDEARRLAEELETHFSGEGWRLETPTAHRWYLALDPPPQLATRELSEVIGRNMDLFLPNGKDGVPWRVRMNEIQMLLHGSPVNREREKQGRVPVNGVWVSGGGILGPSVSLPYSEVFADDALTRGVALAAGVAICPLEAFQVSGGDGAGDVLLTYAALQRAVVRADSFAWEAQLQRFQSWLAPLLGAPGRHELRIYPCDGRCYRLGPAGRYRFWRLAKPYAAYLDGGLQAG